MRHGRKSASKRFNGHKAAVAVDLESQLIAGVEVLAGNAGDQEKAVDLAYDKAPQRVDIACALAEALIQGQDFVRAHDLLADIRAKSPNNPTVVQTEVDLYRAQGQDSKALESYRQILRYDPENVPARLGLAKVYLVLGQTAEARNEFERILMANPTNGDGHEPSPRSRTGPKRT
jgi:predicted Zn-dependent protease